MIYLDNAATSYPKPQRVLDAVVAAIAGEFGNPGRAGHQAARESERALLHCKELLNRLFHGAGSDRFALMLNGTDALNAAIHGMLAGGGHVVTGSLEHNSVMRPLRRLADDGDISMSVIEASPEGYYSPMDVAAAVRDNTRLVALTHASNVVGTVQPIPEIAAVCRARGTPLLVDACQTAGVHSIDLLGWGIDLMAAAGHKGLHGPMGTGVLYVAPGVAPLPWREGGVGADSTESRHPRGMPKVMEAGTPNVLGAIGLAAGLEFLLERGPEAIASRERQLSQCLWRQLAAIPGVRCLGSDTGARLAVISFTVDWLGAQELASLLDQRFGIAVRAGLHCAPGAHRHFGTLPDGAVRVSPGLFNTIDDVEAFVDALMELASAFAV